jgi:hypothetical protein
MRLETRLKDRLIPKHDANSPSGVARCRNLHSFKSGLVDLKMRFLIELFHFEFFPGFFLDIRA